MTDRRRPGRAGTPGPAAGAAAESGGAATAWLGAQQAVAARAAHEVKNALNGVSVNLAVVQSRLKRGAPAEQISRFADAAVDQLERLTVQVEALLAVARPPRVPADLGLIARQLGALLDDGGSEGARVAVTAPPDGAALTAADADVTRAALAALLTRAVEDAGGGACVVSADDGAVQVRVTALRPLDALFDPPLAAMLAAGGVSTRAPTPELVELTFPPANAPPAF